MGAADFGTSEDPGSQRVMHATALSNNLRLGKRQKRYEKVV